MPVIFEKSKAVSRKAGSGNTETYMQFRMAIPKPSHEDAHLRHILRFYLARALMKQGLPDVYVLPEVGVGGKHVTVDVLAEKDGEQTLAVCEPSSVSAETEQLLAALAEVEGLNAIVVHSIYGNSGNVPKRFANELEAKKFRLLAVVPPPFDDVYEYDIWMFETTFRDLFSGR